MTLRSFTTLVLVFLACVAAAWVVSVVILGLYERAVVRRPLAFAHTDAAAAGRAGSRLWVLDEPRKTALVYFVAGLCFAVAMFFATFRPTSADYVGRAAIVIWIFAWPSMLVWKLVSGVGFRGWIAGVVVYFLAGVGVAWLHLSLFPDDFEGSAAALALGGWAGMNWGITVAVPIVMARRVRAVGILVLAATVLASLGALAAVRSQQTVVLAIVAAAAAGALGWPTLRWLSRLYHRRVISDQSLFVDAIWLLYGAMTAMFRWDRGPWMVVPAAIAPFVVFKIVSTAGFARLRRGARPPQGLLLLRVFALGYRSKQLFRALAGRWRYEGPIRLITGPDLAAETVEPNEFMDFMGRRLARNFIDGEATLARRVRELEARPDFDGRYRVEELFCHDDTWAAALRMLIREDHFVLMDLRNFSPANKGCAYEIEELLNTVPLRRVMFVVDTTTDEAFLKATLTEAWARLDADSPNQNAADPTVRLCRLDTINSRTMRTLTSTLVDGGATPLIETGL